MGSVVAVFNLSQQSKRKTTFFFTKLSHQTFRDWTRQILGPFFFKDLKQLIDCQNCRLILYTSTN